MPKTRKKYPSAIKLAYALKLEKVLLPECFSETIPASTLHGWRHDFDIKMLYGNEYSKQIENNLSDTNAILDLSTNFDRKIILSLLYVKKFMVQALSQNKVKALMRENKKKTIQFIEWLDETTSIGKGRITECLGLGRKTISHWKRQVKHICHTSAFKTCMIKNPNQATVGEIKVMKTLLSDPNKSHWGVPSIQGFALKEKLCALSVSSWYTYNRLLNIRTSINRFKKTKFIPLRASKVNEIWHADITIFPTLDGVKHYIYTIKDNFSRKTVFWEIANCVSGKIRMETIQKALDFAFPDKVGKLRLITDGGPENVNTTIKEFLINCQIDINHQIALKDIIQSNSMVEATYHGLKSHFLYGKLIQNYHELKKYLEFYFHDHDHIKPHSAHKIYTPDEVFFGANPKLVDLRPLYKQAGIERRITNKNSLCGVC